ncbi:hypothetical protein, partial [Saccharothrix yanglingensis]|uniref:hypothetical protein n=1 Tax=Saccharothrix yanglingensis TaxID=659496 RepID=UPI0027D21A6B
MRIDQNSGPGQPEFGDARDGLVTLAIAAGLDYVAKKDGGTTSLTLSIPNGRNTRALHVNPAIARVLIRDGIGDVVFLGEYQAIFDRSTGVIEAFVRSVGRFGSIPRELRHLPGVQAVKKDDSSQSEEAHEFEDVDESALADVDEDVLYNYWKLEVSSAATPLAIEFSPATERLAALARRPYREPNPLVSMEIRGVTIDRHDDLLDLLERYASALFFEIDIRFGVAIILQRESRSPIGGGGYLRRNDESAPLAMPKNRYAKPATDLYFYARSATGMPLLQYLAYYQAIEFFFPSFWNAEVLRRLRQELRDVRFNVDDDGELQRLVNIAKNSGRGGTTERQQLQATISTCVDDASVTDFLKKNMFAGKLLRVKKIIEDVPDINERASGSLIDQISDRV